MSITIDNILLVGSILLFISIIAGKTSFRFGIPTLLFFLAVGMLAGSEGIGGIHFDNSRYAQFIGIVALNFILFSGGLNTKWESVRPVLWQGLTLSMAGVLLTAVFLGLFIAAVTDFSLLEGLLLAATISSTDTASVFSLLRSKNLSLKTSLRRTLELEAGSNDPMAYMLTIAFTMLITAPETTAGYLLLLFFKQLVFGGIAGYLAGRLSTLVINRIRLGYEGLYSVLVVTLMFFTFSATDFIGGNGFLAVYIAAVYIGNQNLTHKNTIIKFFDGFDWLMQIILFITLGLLCFPSQIIPFIGTGLLISAFLIFIVRPASVYLCLLPFNVKNRYKLYISWVGLRGAVPIVFATYPILAGVEKASVIFNIVFFISFTSLLIQGTSLAKVAKWLDVVMPDVEKDKTLEGEPGIEMSLPEKVEIELPAASELQGKRIMDIGFSPQTRIISINRNEQYIIPAGDTKLQPLDKLTILTTDKDVVLTLLHCK